MKECTTCKTSKPFDEFYNLKTSKDGKCYRCKQCDTAARHKYKAANKLHCTTLNRNRLLRWKYKIEPEDYEHMLAKQHYVCFICHEGPDESSLIHNKLVVDHDHKTGNVRGLLCAKCNKALGLLKDNQENLKRAINYLKRNNDAN